MQAASGLFAAHGFAQVSMADIAGTLDVGPSSLYRHFANKYDLLREVVSASVGAVGRVTEASDLDEVIAIGSLGAATDRNAAILWQREAGNLDAADRIALGTELVTAVGALATMVNDRRPTLSSDNATLLAWAIIAVFGSTGMHRSSLPRNDFASQLASAARAVCDVELGTTTASPKLTPPDESSLSTREVLLTQAIRLFGERGYAAVSTNDIGRAAGTSGPNLYKHFPSKADVLAAIATRAGEYRRRGVVEALAGVDNATDRLARLLHAHITFAVEQRDLMRVLTGELHQLPDPQRKGARQAQRDYLKLWAQALVDARPDLTPARARIIVPAALAVADDAARTGQIASRLDLPNRLTEICWAVLKSGG
ncbi:putative TetR family transcriptional regulator [Gordonia effusa NBRC 100432]|uniref:Putative TetR family transcriptional regulator n=1 Tax=Gordonia effusa NBRC 100432 TaxID=1077974 RepID=H0QVM7_9ACTN|nr:putative TetR family transcriptional regulator [Gordonia effusa NBRC 100432]